MELFKILGTVAIDGVDKAESALGKLGNAAKKVGKVVAAGLATAGTAAAFLTKATVESYAEFEQLKGGVETLFKDSSATVLKYAQNAYTTAGMSANEYLSTVTSFSASLIQSLGKDTEKAVEYADMAITDMSDNANKMGTDMTLIQNAYQGFAKQNYTMLDNLKLGYGGTKEEMQRLLDTAKEIQAEQGVMVDYSIESYADIVEAIHVVQDEMGIAGATADEAATTIQGSVAATKAAWQNLLTGFADENANMSELVTNVMESAVTAAWNIVPRIIQAWQGITTALPEIMTQAKEKLFETFPEIEEKFNNLKAWLEDVGSYAKEKFQPIIEDVSEVFTKVKDTVQPLIEKLKDYVTSGEASEDITNGLKDAIDFLSEAYQAVKDFINDVIDAVESADEWMKEHEDTVIVLATAFGTLTGAIGAYTAAQAISKAGGVVYLAQLGATAIGVYALDAAQKIATVSTAAFGAVMSFVTSPITLVVLAIGALIAIIVLCVKHWDEIKAKVIEVAQNISEKIEELKENLSVMWTNIMSKALALWESIKSGIKEKVENIKTSVQEKFQNVKDTIEEKITGAKEKVSEIFSNIKNEIQSKIEEARDKVGEAIEKIKGFFNFEWNLPKIKLPHFVKTGEDSLGLPKISVEWYKKGAVLNQPTVFGMNPTTGSAMVGGEAGPEAVAPIDVLQGYVAEAVASQNAGLVTVLERILEAILALDENMGGNLREALDGTSLSINNREFGRLVRTVV